VEPLALLSLMARLGSSQPVELASSHADIIAGFDVGTFGTAPTKFDAGDLWPLTRGVLRATPWAAVADRLPAGVAEPFWLAVRDSVAKVAEVADWWHLAQAPVPVVEPDDAAFVQQALAMLPPQPWGPATWADWTTAVKAATGRKGRALFRPLRLVMTGRETGPEMAALMPFLPVPRP
jgi:glutamyl-tRNA synthetase